jgi:hypothetical protein
MDATGSAGLVIRIQYCGFSVDGLLSLVMSHDHTIVVGGGGIDGSNRDQ